MNTFAVSFLLVVSLAANVALYFWARRLKKKPQESYEVRHLLHDLTAGVALVRVQRVDPAGVFLRAARDSE